MEGVVEYGFADASTVQVLTGVMRKISVHEILPGLRIFMKERVFTGVGDIKGLALRHLHKTGVSKAIRRETHQRAG